MDLEQGGLFSQGKMDPFRTSLIWEVLSEAHGMQEGGQILLCF